MRVCPVQPRNCAGISFGAKSFAGGAENDIFHDNLRAGLFRPLFNGGAYRERKCKAAGGGNVRIQFFIKYPVGDKPEAEGENKREYKHEKGGGKHGAVGAFKLHRIATLRAEGVLYGDVHVLSVAQQGAHRAGMTAGALRRSILIRRIITRRSAVRRIVRTSVAHRAAAYLDRCKITLDGDNLSFYGHRIILSGLYSVRICSVTRSKAGDDRLSASYAVHGGGNYSAGVTGALSAGVDIGMSDRGTVAAAHYPHGRGGAAFHSAQNRVGRVKPADF